MVRREVEKRLENPFTSAKTRFIARLVEEISNLLSRSENTQIAVETHFPHQKYEILTQALTVIEEFLAKVENRKLPRSAHGSNLESRLSTLILKLQSLKTDFQLALQILNTRIGDAYFTSKRAEIALNPVYARIIAVLISLGLLGVTGSTAFAYTTEKASVVESAYPDDAPDSETDFTEADFEILRELLANARKIAEDILASADFNPEQVVAGPEDAIDPQPTIDTVSLTGQTYTVGVASLNVRSGPGTGNDILGTVGNGQLFKIQGVFEDGIYTWYQISFEGHQTAWVADVNSSGRVSESEPIQTEVYKLVPQITTILDETPLRPSNSRDSGFITSLPAGTQVEVIGVEANDSVPPTWIQVRFTQEGQVITGFVTEHVLDLQNVDLAAWEANEQPTQFVLESAPATFPTPEAPRVTQNTEPTATFTPDDLPGLETENIIISSNSFLALPDIQGINGTPIVLSRSYVRNGEIMSVVDGNIDSILPSNTSLKERIKNIINQREASLVVAELNNNVVSKIYIYQDQGGAIQDLDLDKVRQVIVVAEPDPQGIDIASLPDVDLQILVNSGGSILEFTRRAQGTAPYHIIDVELGQQTYEQLGIETDPGISFKPEYADSILPVSIYGFGSIFNTTETLLAQSSLRANYLTGFLHDDGEVYLTINGKVFTHRIVQAGLVLVEDVTERFVNDSETEVISPERSSENELIRVGNRNVPITVSLNGLRAREVNTNPDSVKRISNINIVQNRKSEFEDNISSYGISNLFEVVDHIEVNYHPFEEGSQAEEFYRGRISADYTFSNDNRHLKLDLYVDTANVNLPSAKFLVVLALVHGLNEAQDNLDGNNTLVYIDQYQDSYLQLVGSDFSRDIIIFEYESQP